MNKKERTTLLIDYFKTQQPEITTELMFDTAFQLLCAVMLSAQCTDKRVNLVTPALFKAYPTPEVMAEAEEYEIYEYVKSVSYPNAKAKHLKEMAVMLCDRFNSEVPSTMEELTSLPGVGRKTANVMLAVAFNKPAMPVDTHVFRVSHRLGLVTANDDTPEKVERQLVKIIPSEYLSRAHHWLLLHGRYICTSRSPKCQECPFKTICHSGKKQQ